jgi:hypothetical protein
MNACPKCRGTGFVGYRRDGGICYRCGGAGKIGTHEPAQVRTQEPIAAPAAAPAPTPIVPKRPRTLSDDPAEQWLYDLFSGHYNPADKLAAPTP